MQKTITVWLLGADAFVASVLHRHGHEYVIFHQSEYSTLDGVQGQQPDLLVFLLEDIQLCRWVRQQWPTIPLMVVSADGSDQRIATALDLGADDYVVVPFGEGEFLARLRVLLRRMHRLQPTDAPASPDPLTSQDRKLSLHLAQHRCFLAGQAVRLTRIEFDLLRLLMQHKNRVLTHRFLLQKVWGPAYSEEAGYLRVYLHQLRWKIEADPSHPRYLLTEAGIGYTFHEPAGSGEP
jgi:two-component system KDP operon response regulator KdpE